MIEGQREWNTTNGANGMGDIISNQTISPSDSLHEQSVAVDERDGHAVDFEFNHPSRVSFVE